MYFVSSFNNLLFLKVHLRVFKLYHHIFIIFYMKNIANNNIAKFELPSRFTQGRTCPEFIGFCILSTYFKYLVKIYIRKFNIVPKMWWCWVVGRQRVICRFIMLPYTKWKQRPARTNPFGRTMTPWTFCKKGSQILVSPVQGEDIGHLFFHCRWLFVIGWLYMWAGLIEIVTWKSSVKTFALLTSPQNICGYFMVNFVGGKQ